MNEPSAPILKHSFHSRCLSSNISRLCKPAFTLVWANLHSPILVGKLSQDRLPVKKNPGGFPARIIGRVVEVRFKKIRCKDSYEKSRPDRGFRTGGVAKRHVDGCEYHNATCTIGHSL